MDKRRLPHSRIRLIALAAVLLIALNSIWPNLFGTLDNCLGDFFMRQVARSLSPDPDIVIVDIDEASLAAMQDTDGIARRYALRRDISGWQLESLPARVMRAGYDPYGPPAVLQMLDASSI